MPAPQRTSGRGLPIAVGATLATFGAIFAAAGGGALAITGTDGTLDSGTHDLSTSTSAITSGVARIDHTDDLAKVFGKPTLRVSTDAAADGPYAFVGIGRKKDVDRYLDGVATDEVTDLDVGPWGSDKRERHPGSGHAKPPAKQSFWVAKATGRNASLDWKVRDGNYRVVVMNADGSPGVATDSKFALDIPHMATLSWIALSIGIVMIAGGIVTITGLPKRRES
jgi:hypothetical protein